MTTGLSRRDVLKGQAAAIAAAAAGISLPATAQPIPGGVGALESQATTRRMANEATPPYSQNPH